MAWIGRLVTLAIAAVAIATVSPASIGLSETLGFAQVVALRGLACAGGVAIGVVLLGVWATRRRRAGRAGTRRRPRRRSRALLLGLAFAGAGIAHGAIQVGRGWVAAPTGPAGLTVIAFNTQGRPAHADIAELAEREAAAAVALPETSQATARLAAAELADRGMEYQVFTALQGSHPVGATSLLVSSELGRYRQVAAPFVRLGAVRAVPADGDGPVLAAVHPPPPLPLSFGMRNWARHAATAAGMCEEIRGSLVAGDFNATLDHASLRDLGTCDDAAEATGAGAQGTWPSWLPIPLASPIDHVLFDSDGWAAVSTRAVRAGGSDHRALIARLAPR